MNEGDYNGNADQNGGRRKRVDHTSQQIQELTNFFEECRHPTASEIMDLGERLNLEAKQVKSWFDNRRSNDKKQHARRQNMILLQEQIELKRVNEQLRQATILPQCNMCGNTIAEEDFEAHRLMIENAILEHEIYQLYRILATPSPVAN